MLLSLIHPSRFASTGRASARILRTSLAAPTVNQPRFYQAYPRKAAIPTGNGGAKSASRAIPDFDDIDIDEPIPAPPSTNGSKLASEVAKPAVASATTAQQSSTTLIEQQPSSSPPLLGDDWSKSYFGLSTQPFSAEVAEILQAPLNPNDIEMKPDGIIYLPEIKYRRILNKAFGPGGWGLAPRSETNVSPTVVSREYALVCLGRLVSVARGEQEYFNPAGIPTATEGCKSNALMRCCKDIGIASELWDPRFIREFKTKYCVEVFAEHTTTKKKKKLWRRKDCPKFDYPYKE